MTEFELINHFFKSIPSERDDVIVGMGDDGACVSIAPGMQLAMSTDTLVAERHFLSSWDPYDIAYKAVMVNVSDMAAMGAEPAWLTLALTLPKADTVWLRRFANGLQTAIKRHRLTLIGGDTTKGPLSLTISIQGLIPEGRALLRNGAKPGDKIYVSGKLGAAALAVNIEAYSEMAEKDRGILMEQLLHPEPCVELGLMLRQFASAAIDVSDGLSADLNHICQASSVGACLDLDAIPVHPLVTKYLAHQAAINLALTGGDDYQLCFTIPPQKEKEFLNQLSQTGQQCTSIGEIESQYGLRGQLNSTLKTLPVSGYKHF